MQVHEQSSLAFYVRPSSMTSLAEHRADLEPVLSRDVAGLAAVGHGLVVHEHLAAAYGVTLSEQDRSSVHIRPVDRLLDLIVRRDDLPLEMPRAADGRIAGNCRHFTVLLVALLRARGTPARARCGFGGYFGTGMFEDHWVCEYWDDQRGRWALVDGQIDDRQRELFPIEFDVTDVPRDRFLVAGQAWAACRAGAVDPARFGLSLANEAGLWWIAGNLMRDAAALVGIELLPWDEWGAMPTPDQPIDEEMATFFDRVAALTQRPDADFAELQQLCANDDRLRVPAAVHNAVRKRDEAL